MAHEYPMLEQAIAWAVRTGDPAFDDWEGFTRWLEADPAHAAAYDEVVSNVQDATDAHSTLPAPANDESSANWRGNRLWFAGLAGMAAALAALFGAWTLRDQSYTISTAAGETRLVELDRGGSVMLAGDTRVTLDRGNNSLAVLEQGQVVFDLTHDADNPFRVEVGPNTLVDIGTVFEVKHTARQTSVAVSEGAVLFNPDKERARIDPGQMLRQEGEGGVYTLQPIDPGQVGEWRDGRLTFSDSTLLEVAADLTRATGRRFEVAPGAAGLRVSGSVQIEPVRAQPQSIAPLLGVVIKPSGDRWMIETPSG